MNSIKKILRENRAIKLNNKNIFDYHRIYILIDEIKNKDNLNQTYYFIYLSKLMDRSLNESYYNPYYKSNNIKYELLCDLERYIISKGAKKTKKFPDYYRLELKKKFYASVTIILFINRFYYKIMKKIYHPKTGSFVKKLEELFNE